MDKEAGPQLLNDWITWLFKGMVYEFGAEIVGIG